MVALDFSDGGVALRDLAAVDPVGDPLMVVRIEREKLLARDLIHGTTRNLPNARHTACLTAAAGSLPARTDRRSRPWNLAGRHRFRWRGCC
jgi:hypothetical protein